MPETQFITIGTVLAALVGIIIGSGFERFLRRIESRPVFRITLGYFENLKGRGFNVNVENIGLFPLPKYVVSLHHPSRGSFSVFQMERESEFPQYPSQINRFQCITKPESDSDKKEILTFYHCCPVNCK